MPTVATAPGLVLVEHTFEVPLDHARPDGETTAGTGGRSTIAIG